MKEQELQELRSRIMKMTMEVVKITYEFKNTKKIQTQLNKVRDELLYTERELFDEYMKITQKEDTHY